MHIVWFHFVGLGTWLSLKSLVSAPCWALQGSQRDFVGPAQSWLLVIGEAVHLGWIEPSTMALGDPWPVRAVSRVSFSVHAQFQWSSLYTGISTTSHTCSTILWGRARLLRYVTSGWRSWLYRTAQLGMAVGRPAKRDDQWNWAWTEEGHKILHRLVTERRTPSRCK